jgi:hypothetical protein
VISPLTARNITVAKNEVIPASGIWQSTPHPAVQGWTFPPAPIRNAALALILAVSPVTCGVDPWFADRRRQAAATVGSFLQPISRRRVTVVQARSLALEILRVADRERALLAEEEARRGINWGDDT